MPATSATPSAKTPACKTWSSQPTASSATSRSTDNASPSTKTACITTTITLACSARRGTISPHTARRSSVGLGSTQELANAWTSALFATPLTPSTETASPASTRITCKMMGLVFKAFRANLEQLPTPTALKITTSELVLACRSTRSARPTISALVCAPAASIQPTSSTHQEDACSFPSTVGTGPTSAMETACLFRYSAIPMILLRDIALLAETTQF